ncbi:MAG: undecaprenyldiphospho-muramoylpentapeptide beta-N-acetylglucosaminyltransferase [Verrucomicrobiae bacterium]|nr:undecaprenyldiphospho-muramoylpentapeptide beta-N-acetylglucosaminyltransferase [Verrucomicrobiae bacterium]
MGYRIAIACGGTGGHLFPGLAVADVLREQGNQILLLVSNKDIDRSALNKHQGYEFRVLSAVGWPGFRPFLLVHFFWRYFQAVRECKKWFKVWKPDAVLGMGGFTSAVPLRYAIKRKIPTLMHESNVIPGRVTVWLSKKVDKVLLGFEACRSHLASMISTGVTGTPLKVKPKLGDRIETLKKLGLSPEKKTILVMGGSQGAKALNELVVQAMRYWEGLQSRWQFIHLTGKGERELVELNYRREGFQAQVMEFCGEMAEIYRVTDLAISRSGAASLSELTAWEIPSVLIPFPFAAGNHQFFNAQVFEKAGAALMEEQDSLTPEILGQKIKILLEDEEQRQRMHEACRKVAIEDGAERVADAVMRAIEEKPA